jgi:hypothetical protein
MVQTNGANTVAVSGNGTVLPCDAGQRHHLHRDGVGSADCPVANLHRDRSRSQHAHRECDAADHLRDQQLQRHSDGEWIGGNRAAPTGGPDSGRCRYCERYPLHSGQRYKRRHVHRDGANTTHLAHAELRASADHRKRYQCKRPGHRRTCTTFTSTVGGSITGLNGTGSGLERLCQRPYDNDSCRRCDELYDLARDQQRRELSRGRDDAANDARLNTAPSRTPPAPW